MTTTHQQTYSVQHLLGIKDILYLQEVVDGGLCLFSR